MAYITRDEFENLGASDRILARFSDDRIDLAMEAASSEADTYFCGAFSETPLEEIPLAVKMHVARAALYHLLSPNFSPDADNQIVLVNYDNAKAFYKAVQKSQQNLPQSQTVPTRDECVVVSSNVRRGW